MASDQSPPLPPRLDRARLDSALKKARGALLAARGPHGHWEGELSSSALSTATAVTALELWQRAVPAASSRISSGNATEAAAGSTPARAAERSAASGQQTAIEGGLKWLAEHQNADGGWGDTVLSFSNISTTALCWAAFGAAAGAEARWSETVRRAEAWLAEKCSVFSVQGSDPNAAATAARTENWKLNTGLSNSQPAPNQPEAQPQTSDSKLETASLISAIIARYGKDRTFSVPILTMCALAGRLGEGKEAWRRVMPLPFELAALPQKFFAALRLPVVSYALPALIAIGQARHHHLPSRNPLTRLLRDRVRARTLRVLERIQPPNGGFLEATPLTSFVTMSLAGSGQADHPVTQRGVKFLLQSVRPDGSWPIDTNLATWVTTLAVNALGPSIHEVMSAEERGRILEWLLGQQYRTVHPYTNAPPGGWAWTDLPGGVPDADDTAGALLALKTLSGECGMRNAECGMKSRSAAVDESERRDVGSADSALRTPHSAFSPDPRVRAAAIAGVKWLLDLQNRDGGIPTFCRGWTNLPFDRSSPDITAHALRASHAWQRELPPALGSRINSSSIRALRFLKSSRRADGSWLPLWFGNQSEHDDENPTYGTAQVLRALAELQQRENSVTDGSALNWFLSVQQNDGSWSGGPRSKASVEETALALAGLAACFNQSRKAAIAIQVGTESLLRRVEDGTWTQPTPIGFYFAKLWYYERLYPMIFTVAALEAVARLEQTEK